MADELPIVVLFCNSLPFLVALKLSLSGSVPLLLFVGRRLG